jgi:hypothetical protein
MLISVKSTAKKNCSRNAGDAAKIVVNLDVIVPVQDHEKHAVNIGQELARIGMNRDLISQQQCERTVNLYSPKPMVEIINVYGESRHYKPVVIVKI